MMMMMILWYGNKTCHYYYYHHHHHHYYYYYYYFIPHLQLIFFWLKASDAAPNTATSFAPAATAASNPWW